MKDPIVEEVRRVREKIFAECDNDLDKLMERLKEAESLDKDRLVTKEMLNQERKAAIEAEKKR